MDSRGPGQGREDGCGSGRERARTRGPTRRRFLAGLAGTAGAAGLAGCSGGEPAPTEFQPAGGWLDTRLTAVRSGEAFTVGGLQAPVLVEFFAVWCPACTDQQEEIEALHERTDGFSSVSLNTDPNEDAAVVRRHLDQHGFGWRYAIAPVGMTEALVEQFGSAIATPPSAPVVLVCPDGRARRLPDGVASAETLAGAIDEC